MSSSTEHPFKEVVEKDLKHESATTGDKNTPNKGLFDTVADSPYFAHHDDAKSKRGLPEWLNHFNAKDLKTLFKCSVAVWIATLFLLIDPVLAEFGQATFFGCIVLFILPCNGIVFINIMGGLTMIIGMALGWTWGVISMKAALATRPAAETNARLAQLASESSRQQMNTEQTTGQSAYTQVLIFDGFMLDKRVTITYFCMIGLFVYLVARLRVAAPKLALLQMFAIIVSDIFVTTGPLLPSFSGTIPSVLIKPAAAAIGIGVVCNILFFPQSTSHLVLETMEGVVAPMSGFFHACKIGFKDSHAQFNPAQLQKTKAGIVAAFKGVEASMGFLALDLSTGRWNAEDVQSLHEPLRHLLIMFMGLLQLQINLVDSRAKREKLRLLDEVIHGNEKSDGMPEVGQNHLAQMLSLRDRYQHPETEDLLEKSMNALFTSSGPLLDTCSEAVSSIMEALQSVNGRRWFGKPTVEECNTVRMQHEDVLRRLRVEATKFRKVASQHLLDPHNHLFDEHGYLRLQAKSGAPVHGLMIGMIFEERILGVASALDEVLTQVTRLESERTRAKIWFPKGLQNLFSWGLGKEDTPGVAAMPPDNEHEEPRKSPTKKDKKATKRKAKDEKEAGAQAQLDRLHVYGGTKRSKFGKILLGVTHWLGSTEGLYALRVLVVTIAMAVPGVLTSSAGFYYREKGLWALIMAQTGLVTYTADFVYGFVLRIIGTVMGGILGMLCWYIGAGNGRGNSYGMAAVMAIAIVVLMWGRLFAPPALLQGVILMAATLYLVVAYSWVDTHIPSYGNPGVGYSVFWRRILLVIIGFSASAIVTFIPRPPSASRHYRRVLSNTIRNSKDLYALYVTSWSRTYPDLQEVSEKNILATYRTLEEITGPIGLLKFEFSSSNFNAETLTHVVNLCITINQCLSQMLEYSHLLPQDLKERFARLSGALDDRLIGDLMGVLTLVEQSLKTGDPLPAVLPVPLIARCANLDRALSKTENEKGSLSIDTIKEEGFRKYCVVLSAFIQLLGCADELVFRVKTAVGETSRVDRTVDYV